MTASMMLIATKPQPKQLETTRQYFLIDVVLEPIN
jgi:hypothetical protein